MSHSRVDLKGLSLGREDGGAGVATPSLLSCLLSCASQSHRTLDMLFPGRVCRDMGEGSGKPSQHVHLPCLGRSVLLAVGDPIRFLPWGRGSTAQPHRSCQCRARARAVQASTWLQPQKGVSVSPIRAELQPHAMHTAPALHPFCCSALL